MKKFLALVITFVIAISSVAFTGCSNKQQIDESKVQLYIGNYDGGVGSEWLSYYKTEFEKLYKDTEFDNGKKGVEVIVANNKVTFAGNTLLNNRNMPLIETNVIFTEGVKYYDFIDEGWLADITDVVESQIPGESVTIADKLTDKQKSYYKDKKTVNDVVEEKYYAIPHYNVYPGIVYDVDLFNEYGMYITSNEGGEVVFGGRKGDAVLSAGPDGDITTTYDNGLPATFDEFFALCEYMVANEVTPICWSMNNGESYAKFLIDVMYPSAQGAEQAESRYTVTETGMEVDMIEGFDANGNPNIVKKTLNQSSYTDINKMSGMYYAHDFTYRLIKGGASKEYFYDRSFTETQNKNTTQYTYLHSNVDTTAVQKLTKPIAMMVEGTWWEEEASRFFEEMTGVYGQHVSKENRNFGFMPLPKKDYNSLGNPVMLDLNNSMVFVNSNTKGVQLDVAKKFLQFISTDANLEKFAQITGVARDYQVQSIDEDDFTTNFSKCVFELKNNGTTLYSRNVDRPSYEWFNNTGKGRVDLYASTVATAVAVENTFYTAAYTFYTKDIDAKTYFEGMSKYVKDMLG